jgi:hypothetical protein
MQAAGNSLQQRMNDGMQASCCTVAASGVWQQVIPKVGWLAASSSALGAAGSPSLVAATSESAVGGMLGPMEPLWGS